jgi:lysophospholipase L1-like esterase
MPQKITHVMSRLFLVILGVCLALGIIEVSLDISSLISTWSREHQYAQASSSDQSVRILAIGESTTEGFGSKAPWPSRMETILQAKFPTRRFQVFNKGIAGVTSAYIANRLPEWMDKYKPHFVVSMIGINDRGHVFIFSTQPWLPEWISELRTYRFLRGLVRRGIKTDDKCKAQMRIIAFIQDAHSIKDIMKAQGIPDFQAPPPIPKFIDTVEAIDELPSYDSFEPSPDDF